MIRVRVQETRLFTNLNPTEVAVVIAQLERQLNDHFDPRAVRARKKWREEVDLEMATGSLRYFCNCKVKEETGEEDCIVHVTGITRTHGRRGAVRPTR